MTQEQSLGFLGSLHDCYFSTDPRVNKDLAKQLSGKNVVLAGAGRGIGRACAEFLSYAPIQSLSIAALEQDEIDESVAICAEINPLMKTKARALDVRDPGAVRQFLEEVEAEFGGIDVLHMNAGRPPQWLPTAEGDAEIWWETVGVSLRGAYNFSRFALPIMQKKRQGTIIFTASAGAHANQALSSYIVAKLAMVRLAEIIHVENFHQYNIKSFAIHPGNSPTRFYHDFKDKVEGRQKAASYIVDGADGEEKSARLAITLLEQGTFDTPYMAAGMVTVLCSGQLDFMSGRYVDCSVKVEDYLEKRNSILENDEFRVRLNAGDVGLIPKLGF